MPIPRAGRSRGGAGTPRFIEHFRSPPSMWRSFLCNCEGAVLTVSRLAAQWQADHDVFQRRDLSGRDYVYVWRRTGLIQRV